VWKEFVECRDTASNADVLDRNDVLIPSSPNDGHACFARATSAYLGGSQNEER
jgi:hypothetical protein